MWLCLTATAGRDTLVTLAGSEPFLAEAAYKLVKEMESNPVVHLANHSDLNVWVVGTVGSLLQLFSSCEHATLHKQHRQAVDGFLLNVFMGELLPHPNTPISRNLYQHTTAMEKRKNLRRHSRNYGIWFNHVIKVEKHKMFLLPTTSGSLSRVG